MHRILVAAAVLLLLPGCRVQRTPPEFLEQREPAQVDRRDAALEVEARIGAFRQALSRGDRATAAAALIPTPVVHVVGIDRNAGLPRYGPDGLEAALGEIAVPDVAVARTPDLRVQVSLRQGVAWFATHVELMPVRAAAEPAQRFRMSGVMARDRGEWRLMQVHFSRALPDDDDADEAG